MATHGRGIRHQASGKYGFRQPIPDDGTIEVVDGAAQPDSVAEEPEEDDTFDETLETKPRFRRKKSVYEGFANVMGGSAEAGHVNRQSRQGSVYEGFVGEELPDPEGTTDAAGNWVPQVEDYEADSDDEWADTGEVVVKRDDSGQPLDQIHNGIEEEDLLISALDQVTLFGTGVANSTCVKSGWLKKANGSSPFLAKVERAKLRWFELHNDTLYYYRFVPPEVGRAKALGFVCIGGMDVMVSSPRELEIVITTPKRPYHLFFEHAADHKAWLRELVRANGEPC